MNSGDTESASCTGSRGSASCIGNGTAWCDSDGAASFASPVRLSAAGAIWLFIASALAGSGGNRGTGFAALGFFVVSGLLFAAAAFIVQQGANAYQEARYPGRQFRGMTTGEVIATVIGVIIFALSIVGALIGG